MSRADPVNGAAHSVTSRARNQSPWLTWVTSLVCRYKYSLQDLVAAELAASGLGHTELASDVAFVENGIRSVLSGLKARRAWENHVHEAGCR